jgi:hypothetical protein
MKRILLVAVTCLLSGHAVGEAQRRIPETLDSVHSQTPARLGA